MRLIDADELKTAFPTCDNSKSILIASVRATINHMPTIEERKTGKWNCSDDYYETGVCSACEWDVGEAYADCKKWFKYCPNCGADMRGEGQE